MQPDVRGRLGIQADDPSAPGAALVGSGFRRGAAGPAAGRGPGRWRGATRLAYAAWRYRLVPGLRAWTAGASACSAAVLDLGQPDRPLGPDRLAGQRHASRAGSGAARDRSVGLAERPPAGILAARPRRDGPAWCRALACEPRGRSSVLLAVAAVGRGRASRGDGALPRSGTAAGATAMPAATLRSRSISVRESGRCSPGGSPLRTTGPIATRVRLMTLWPSLASIRRISRFLPSASTSSSVVASPCVPTIRARLARTLPSESQMPSVSLSRISRLGGAGHERPVDLLDAVTRMRQPVGQLAVVGQDHQPGAVLVEPADGVDPLGDLGEQVDHAGPARGVVVGRDVALGLVHGVVDHLLELDPLAVDGDGRLLGIDPRAQLADDLAVDRDPPLEDVLLAVPARAEPGMRRIFWSRSGLPEPGSKAVCPFLSDFGLGMGLGLAPERGAPSRPPCPRRLWPCRRPLLVRLTRLDAWLWAWPLASCRRPARFRSSAGTWAQTRAWPRMLRAPARRLRFAIVLAAGWSAASHGDLLPAKPDLGRATAAGERDTISRQLVILKSEVHLKGLTGPLDSARRDRLERQLADGFELAFGFVLACCRT